MHAYVSTVWSMRRRTATIALLGGFLLLAIAGFAWAGLDDDVDISVTALPTTFIPGDTVVFTVLAENIGPAYTANLEFRITSVTNATNPKPAITGATNVMSGGNVSMASNGNPIITSAAQSLPTGNTSYDVTVSIPSGYTGGDLAVRAEAVNVDPSDGDPEEGGALTIKLNTPKLALTKTGTASAQRSTAVNYTVTASNTGIAIANNVVITDTLPLGLTGISSGTPGCSVNPTGTVLTCGPFSINPAASKTVTVSATVSATAACGQAQTNQASVSYETPQGTPLPAVNASANTTVTCPTPTPTPSATPTPTPKPPTPTPTPSPASTTNSSTSSGSGSGTGSSSGSGTGTVAGTSQGRVLGAASVVGRVPAADLKAPDYILFARVPLIVEQLFAQVFGRKITPAESVCWKLRARSDKATLSKLKGAMAFHKGKGSTGFTSFCKPPKLGAAFVDDLFKIVYGRTPSISELKYWQKRHKDKPTQTALRGAMLFHKVGGIAH